jgi:hypothetical protein
MEHAIRKHCTVHHDEDPAFYQSLSQKVDALLEKHQEEWELLVERLAELRNEAIAGRRQGEDGMSKEAAAFYDHIAQAGFSGESVADEDKSGFRALMESIVEILQETIASIDFWHNPDKQKRVRGLIKNQISTTGITELKQNRERVNGEVFFYLGSRYRLSLVEEQDEALKLKNGRFYLRRTISKHERSKVFCEFYTSKGVARVDYFAGKVGVKPGKCVIKDIGITPMLSGMKWTR